MEFKYKAKFVASANLSLGKWRQAKASNAVFESLDDLRSLLPSDAEIEENPDLLYTGFNVAVANLVNDNGHAIDTETTLEVAKLFVNKHLNVEHSKYEVIGHVISQGFSQFGSSKMLTAEEVSGSNQPFNICLGAVVYKIVSEYMAEILMESTKEHNHYSRKISASWEIGFNEFDIVLGSRKLADAQIISDPVTVEEYTQYLTMDGGSGLLPDGTPVYCLIKGKPLPLGCALTFEPAASVSGMHIPTKQPKNMRAAKASVDVETVDIDKISSDITEAVVEKLSRSSNFEKKVNSKTEINSPSTKKAVITNMKLKSTDDITVEFLQTAEASSSIKTFITEKINEASSGYVTEIDSLKNEKRTAEASINTANAKIEELNASLTELKGQIEKREKQELFDSRMEDISASFELSDTQRTAVASQIKDLDENAFADWKTKVFEPFAVKKSEKGKENSDPSQSLRTAVASTQAALPNTVSTGDADQIDTLVSGLSEGFKIN